jgi:aryl-alcohol dehydrogenase-like predicted oxidoreductase
MSNVQLRTLGRTGLQVSNACLGTMTFGTPGWGCGEDTAAEIVNAFSDAGGNFFDTADIYAGGESERILGRALRGRRDQCVVATKVGNTSLPGPNGRGLSRKHIHEAVKASLKRLQTDYIDLYQVHYFDSATPVEETLATLDSLVQAGLVRYIGCSNFFAWQLAEANMIAAAHGWEPFASCQMMYNLVRRDLETGHFAYCAQRGTALITYSPLHSGLLTGEIARDAPPPPSARIAASGNVRQVYMGDEERVWRTVDALAAAARESGYSPAQLALGWVFRQPSITSVIVGAATVGHLEQNLSALDIEAAPSVWKELDEATALPPSYPTDFYQRLQWSLARTNADRQ